MTMLRYLTLSLALITAPVSAQDWRDAANAFDRDRLDNAPVTLGEALAEARAGGAPEDVATIENLLVPIVPIGGEALLGDWKCRTIKLGGAGKLTVYSWFKCRISLGENGLEFLKMTGSQRTSGDFWPIYPESGEGFPIRYVYLGASHYSDEEPKPYGGPGNTLGRDSNNRDDAAILEAIGPDRLRMGFPSPIFESKYDFLELRR